MKFLFWNINKKDLSDTIIEICQENDIDILGICEGEELDKNNIIKKLNFKEVFLLSNLKDRGIKLFCKKNINMKVNTENNSYHKEYSLLIENINYKILLLHLPSKLRLDNISQSQFATRFREILKGINYQGKKTIIFGDFNMNPFEEGIISSEAFHALNSKLITSKIQREVYGEKRYYFYNPTWFLYAKSHNEIIGSYYYNSSDFINLFWNMFDQVIISPDLINNFNFDTFKIIEKTILRNLCKNGKPNEVIYSDHLPIFFEFNLNIRKEKNNGLEFWKKYN